MELAIINIRVEESDRDWPIGTLDISSADRNCARCRINTGAAPVIASRNSLRLLR
jgi:hypothetical protein